MKGTGVLFTRGWLASDTFTVDREGACLLSTDFFHDPELLVALRSESSQLEQLMTLQNI